jgi:hypothetical protein
VGGAGELEHYFEAVVLDGLAVFSVNVHRFVESWLVVNRTLRVIFIVFRQLGQLLLALFVVAPQMLLYFLVPYLQQPSLEAAILAYLGQAIPDEAFSMLFSG